MGINEIFLIIYSKLASYPKCLVVKLVCVCVCVLGCVCVVSQDSKAIVMEQPSVFGTGRSPVGSGSGGIAHTPDAGDGGMANSHSSSEEKFSDNISSASEASETTSGSEYTRDTAA